MSAQRFVKVEKKPCELDEPLGRVVVLEDEDDAASEALRTAWSAAPAAMDDTGIGSCANCVKRTSMMKEVPDAGRARVESGCSRMREDEVHLRCVSQSSFITNTKTPRASAVACTLLLYHRK